MLGLLVLSGPQLAAQHLKAWCAATVRVVKSLLMLLAKTLLICGAQVWSQELLLVHPYVESAGLSADRGCVSPSGHRLSLEL